MNPCPLCKSINVQKLIEHNSATGADGVLNYCNDCACCAPPSTWNITRADIKRWMFVANYLGNICVAEQDTRNIIMRSGTLDERVAQAVEALVNAHNAGLTNGGPRG